MNSGVLLKPPAPYFGSKTRVAPTIWGAFGTDVPNYVEPFCGMAGCLLQRPQWEGKVETINDSHALIPNVWRAIRAAPHEVAYWCDQPVFEADLHAVHRWLVQLADPDWVQRVRTDPDFYDPIAAGRWLWGKSAWIGSGWCPDEGVAGHPAALYEKRPSLDGFSGRPSLGRGVHSALHHKSPRLIGGSGGVDQGVGVHARGLHRVRPDLRGWGADSPHQEISTGVYPASLSAPLYEYFERVACRVRYVRALCGDWSRVVTPAVTTSHGITAILLDPPYAESTGRKPSLYAVDDGNISAQVRSWALQHGDDPRLRIVLCGLEGEHDMPSWRCVPWQSRSAYKNAARERLWLSPHCLDQDTGQLDLI